MELINESDTNLACIDVMYYTLTYFFNWTKFFILYFGEAEHNVKRLSCNNLICSEIIIKNWSFVNKMKRKDVF